MYIHVHVLSGKIWRGIYTLAIWRFWAKPLIKKICQNTYRHSKFYLCQKSLNLKATRFPAIRYVCTCVCEGKIEKLPQEGVISPSSSSSSSLPSSSDQLQQQRLVLTQQNLHPLLSTPCSPLSQLTNKLMSVHR